jgi:RHS repeat-associated protein
MPKVALQAPAGDVVSGRVSYYYRLPADVTPANTPIMGWLGQSLLGSLNTSMQGVLKTQAARIASVQTVGDGPLAQFMAAQPPRSRSPRAFVHYLFFDEQLNFVAKGSGTVAVNAPATGSNAAEGVLTYRAVVPRNGYVYVYLSNESTNIPVYFDNLLVNHRRGAIVEDLSYYPHGLPVATVCGRAAVMEPSRYGYQGAYAEEEGETGYNSFALRQYDPQIGRWVQADPYDEFASGYLAMGNDPANITDPTGGITKSSYQPLNKPLNFAVDLLTGLISGDKFLNPMSIITNRQNGSLLQAQTNTLNSIERLSQPNENWLPFYKKDLEKYIAGKGLSITDKILGDEFEKIFENYMLTIHTYAASTFKFRRPDNKWTGGESGNSKPDFVADDFYDERADCAVCPKKIKWVAEGSGYEVKQNNGRGIYLSSNDWQIKRHITNLSVIHQNDIRSNNYNPSLTLITTYDVSWSTGIALFALTRNVQYFHRRAMYRLVNKQYEFKFVGFLDSTE